MSGSAGCTTTLKSKVAAARAGLTTSTGHAAAVLRGVGRQRLGRADGGDVGVRRLHEDVEVEGVGRVAGVADLDPPGGGGAAGVGADGDAGAAAAGLDGAVEVVVAVGQVVEVD